VATTDPWPSPAELDHAYGTAYRPGSGRFAGVGDAVLRRSRASLARRLDRIAPPGKVLDVGAGDGALLEALRELSREAVGLERSPALPGIAEQDLSEIDGIWAAVVFWHSLEHLPEPAVALECAVGLLASDGVLVVAVPNSDSFQARVFGDRWLALDPPRHLVHLTAAALEARLQTLGLRVERVSYLRGGQVIFGWLDGMVGALPGHPSLYDAIRRPEARFKPLSSGSRLAALLAGVLLLPLALAATAIEVLARRGGTVYVEARAV
jgi:SAM-dependent methyltransferase